MKFNMICGSAYMFQVKWEDPDQIFDIAEIIEDSRASAMIETDTEHIKVILFNTFNRHAYDIYKKAHGEHIMQLDPFTVSLILNFFDLEVSEKEKFIILCPGDFEVYKV